MSRSHRVIEFGGLIAMSVAAGAGCGDDGSGGPAGAAGGTSSSRTGGNAGRAQTPNGGSFARAGTAGALPGGLAQTGGLTATGGTAQAAGGVQSGGTGSPGGTSQAGSMTRTGGARATGGAAQSSGGAQSGGAASVGGASPAGGEAAAGGAAQSTGGAQSGGVASVGGASPAGGGATAGGAARSTGGAQSGGTAVQGGSSPTGGVTQSGGGSTVSQGGSAGASAAGSGGASSAGGARPGWTDEWNADSSTRFYSRATSPSAATSNLADTAAQDGRALRLLLGPNPQPTPAGAAEVGTNARLQFGTFSTRLRTADCTGQPDAGVVTGFFTYFNDGSDSTGDGLPDNSEIDFEWLCAEPETVYLTMWTDYRDSDGAQKRVSRGVNLATGTILYTCYYTAFGDCTESLSGTEATPSTVAALEGYDSSAAYYEYGFDWATDSVVWWLRNAQTGERIVLWDFRGPLARITQLPAALLTNVWHTSDWTPNDQPNATQAPTQPVSVWVDWTRYAAP